MTDIRIREASVQDAAVLAALNQELHDFHAEAVPRNFKLHATEPVHEAFEAQLTKENVRALIAEMDGESVGYALLFIQRRPDDAFCYERRWVYLDQIVVRSTHRGRGVGERLLEAVKEVAGEVGVEEIELQVWKFNASARGFFLRKGFEEKIERLRMRLDDS